MTILEYFYSQRTTLFTADFEDLCKALRFEESVHETYKSQTEEWNKFITEHQIDVESEKGLEDLKFWSWGWGGMD